MIYESNVILTDREKKEIRILARDERGVLRCGGQRKEIVEETKIHRFKKCFVDIFYFVVVLSYFYAFIFKFISNIRMASGGFLNTYPISDTIARRVILRILLFD